MTGIAEMGQSTQEPTSPTGATSFLARSELLAQLVAEHQDWGTNDFLRALQADPSWPTDAAAQPSAKAVKN